jgi:hypothetical protein
MNNAAITKIHTQDRVTNQLQQNLIDGIARVQAQVNAAPSGGIFLTSVQLKTGDNIVQQNLNRVPVGFIITDTTAASSIYRSDWTTSNITLNASAPTTISLFLF